jgi:hypothetical protein
VHAERALARDFSPKMQNGVTALDGLSMYQYIILDKRLRTWWSSLIRCGFTSGPRHHSSGIQFSAMSGQVCRCLKHHLAGLLGLVRSGQIGDHQWTRLCSRGRWHKVVAEVTNAHAAIAGRGARECEHVCNRRLSGW